MKRFLIVLVMVLGTMGVQASHAVGCTETAEIQCTITDATLENLFMQATDVWEVSVAQLWVEYKAGVVTVTPIASRPGWYQIARQLEGGVAIITLEDSL